MRAMSASLHDRPNAVELLDAVADTLEQRVLPTAGSDTDTRHDVRVAISISRIVARQLADETFEADMTSQLQSLLSATREGPELTGPDLLSAVARRVDESDLDPAFERAARSVIKNLVSRKLNTARPGYASSPSASTRG